MSQSPVSQIEESFRNLPISEQRELIERLVYRVNEQNLNRGDYLDGQLVQMAADLDIQRELRGIA
jgi:hypothetical protein